MAYWMVACSVYLYIVIFGVNVRICRWWCDRDMLAIRQEVRPDRR